VSQATVLVGFAEALSAPEVVWSLADAGFRVCAFGRRGRRSALRYSRYVTVTDVTAPETDAAATVREVGALVRSLSGSAKSHQAVLFPLDDAAVWLCDRVMEMVNDGVALAGPSGRQVAIALDKAVQMETARCAGFNVLPTRVARTKDEVLQGDNRFPVVLKPSQAVGWAEGRLRKGRHWICGNREELETAVRGWAEAFPLLVQPYVVGTGEGVFGLSRAGGVDALSGHRRIRMMNPHGSGSSACASQHVPTQWSAAAEKFVQISNWQGLFMIEMLRDSQGTAWFMEFNGRPWGSLALARRQGFEYPVWNVRLARDPHWRLTNSPPVQPDLVCRNLGRELMHPLFLLKGPKSAALTEWPPLWKSLLDVLDFGGDQALYNWRRDDKRVFFADCFNTLLDNLIKKAR
jgi:predicted ATP-grasp superfamily ATP-dependent carboligase